MKFIREENDDGSWHIMNAEMPPITSNVEVLKDDGTILSAEIVVEMSGHYIYFRDGEDGEQSHWGSLDDYTHWRFRNANQ